MKIKRTLMQLFYMAVSYFCTKKLVITKHKIPGEFKALIIDKDGNHYIRTVWPANKIDGRIPLQDLPMKDVVGIREEASRFRKDVLSIFGKKPKTKYARFAGGKHQPTKLTVNRSPVKTKNNGN
jgi:hypothetical protein